MKNGKSLPQPPTLHRNGTNGNHHPHGADQVMLGFQELMSRFLETQRAVMTSYLNGEIQSPAPALPPLRQDSSIFETKRTVSPAPESRPDQGDRFPATRLNGGSEPARTEVARVEQRPVAAPAEVAEAEPDASSPGEISFAEINRHLITIVGERTGYPEDMLDVDLDLEADLGIDSIKRVEILGELAEFIMPDSTGMEDEGNLDLEKLSSLRTLQEILDYLEEFLENPPETETAESTVKKKLKV